MNPDHHDWQIDLNAPSNAKLIWWKCTNCKATRSNNNKPPDDEPIGVFKWTCIEWQIRNIHES